MEMMSELEVKDPEFEDEPKPDTAETNQPVAQDEGGEAQPGEEQWFEQLVDEYDYELPKRGQILEGRIIRIDEDAILVDVGLKRDAIVPGREVSQLDSELLGNLSPGDMVHVFVLRPPSGDQDLLVSINKGMEHESWLNAQRDLENEAILELPIMGYNKGGLLVKYENLRGFVPASQVPDLRRIGDRMRLQRKKQELVSESLIVKPMEVNQQRNRLVFSATAAQDERRQRRLQELEKGQVFLQARVVSVVDFGVFVDLDGVDGLVHISQLDWAMIDKPSDLFKPGDAIDVKVIDVDVERERVSLSRKALLPSPWDTIDERYKTGDILEGKVTRVVNFGAFVEIESGLEGLVHVSELGYSSTGRPTEVVSDGDKVLIRILDIDKARERLSLSMRRVPLTEQMAWIANVAEAATAAESGEVVSEVSTPDEKTAVEAGESLVPAQAEASAGSDEAPEQAGEDASAEVESPTAEAEKVEESESEAETTPEVEAETTPEVEAETAPEVEAETAPEVEAETAPEIEAEPAPEIEAEPAPEIEAEPAPEIEAKATPEVEAVPASEAEAEPAPEAEAEVAPEAKAEVASEEPEEAPEEYDQEKAA